VSSIGKEDEKGGAPQGGKSAPRRKEAGTPQKRKYTGKMWRERSEESGRKGGAPCKGRSAARGMEEEFAEDAEKKS